MRNIFNFKVKPEKSPVSCWRGPAMGLCIGLLAATPTTAFAQSETVTIKRNNTKLETILEDIKAQTDYLFVHNSGVNVSELKSISVKNRPVSEVLNKLLAGSDCSYKVEGKHIILSITPPIKTGERGEKK